MAAPDLAARLAWCEALYGRLAFFAQYRMPMPELSEEACVVRMPFGPEHHGMSGTLQGGTLCAIADALSAFVISMSTGWTWVVTTDLQVQYLRPVNSPLVARGRVIRAGKQMAVVQVDCEGGEGKLGAIVILKLLRVENPFV